MSLFRRRPMVPTEVREALARAREEAGLRRDDRVLAAAAVDGGWCVAQRDVFAHNENGRPWTLLGWHEFERGGFNAQNSSLTWQRAGGRRGSLYLAEPGPVPDVFRERIEATVVLEDRVPIPGTREGGLVSARRDLTVEPPAIVWSTHRGRGTPDTAEVQALLDARLERLRAEYS